jgi:cytochrome c oxidase subunit 2
MPDVVRARLLPLLGAALLGALLLAPQALADGAGFYPPEPHSPNAEGINEAYTVVLIFTGFIFVLVQGLLLTFIVRFRRRRRSRDEPGPQVHGSTRLELIWTVFPVLILVVIGTFIFLKLDEVDHTPDALAGERPLEVTVKGYRFYWQFEYENGVIAVDTLRAPAGRTVALSLIGPEFDVIHSWWIPELGGKLDVIPGKPNRTWFRAERAGTYVGQCAELCGIQHAAMLASVQALPAEEFDAWYETADREQQAGTSELGEETWVGACAKCHGLEGKGLIGPRLAGSALVEDADAVEQVVRDGRGQMPPVGRDWSDRQMRALTDYLKESLGGDQG